MLRFLAIFREFDWYALWVLAPTTVLLALAAKAGGWEALLSASFLVGGGYSAGSMFTRRAMLRELFVTGRIKTKKSDGG